MAVTLACTEVDADHAYVTGTITGTDLDSQQSIAIRGLAGPILRGWVLDCGGTRTAGTMTTIAPKFGGTTGATLAHTLIQCDAAASVRPAIDPVHMEFSGGLLYITATPSTSHATNAASFGVLIRRFR